MVNFDALLQIRRRMLPVFTKKAKKQQHDINFFS